MEPENNGESTGILDVVLLSLCEDFEAVSNIDEG